MQNELVLRILWRLLVGGLIPGLIAVLTVSASQANQLATNSQVPSLGSMAAGSGLLTMTRGLKGLRTLEEGNAITYGETHQPGSLSQTGERTD